MVRDQNIVGVQTEGKLSQVKQMRWGPRVHQAVRLRDIGDIQMFRALKLPPLDPAIQTTCAIKMDPRHRLAVRQGDKGLHLHLHAQDRLLLGGASSGVEGQLRLLVVHPTPRLHSISTLCIQMQDRLDSRLN